MATSTLFPSVILLRWAWVPGPWPGPWRGPCPGPRPWPPLSWLQGSLRLSLGRAYEYGSQVANLKNLPVVRILAEILMQIQNRHSYAITYIHIYILHKSMIIWKQGDPVTFCCSFHYPSVMQIKLKRFDRLLWGTCFTAWVLHYSQTVWTDLHSMRACYQAFQAFDKPFQHIPTGLHVPSVALPYASVRYPSVM